MAQLRFFKKNTAPTGDRVVTGSIWFNTSNKTIEVYNGSKWEQYAGKLTNANWDTAKQTLTINKADGSSIVLDFSGIASLAGVQAALTTLKNELTPLITSAQDAADAAQSHSEGVAGNLATEISNRTTADTNLGNRIGEVEADLAQEISDRTTADAGLNSRLTEVEGKVTSLSSATHFLGVKDSLPSVESSTAGDIVIVGNKEYVFDTTKGWVELGDTTNELQRIGVLEGDVSNLKTKVDVEKVSTAITAEIGKLDANVNSTGGSKVSVNVTEVDGKVTSVTVTEDDIASAAALSTAEGKIAALEGKVDVAKVSTAISDAIKALDSEKASTNGDHVNVTVTMIDGKVTGVSIDEDDIASAASLSTAEGKIASLEGKVDVAKVSTAISDAIKALDSNVTSSDGSHVNVKVTLTDGKVTAVNITETDIASAAALSTAEGKIEALEGRMDAVEDGLTWEEFV